MNVNGNDIVIEIGASSKSAATNIKELSDALKDLKTAVSGRTNLSKKLTDLVKSVNGLSGSSKKLNSISKLFDSIGNLGQAKIPKSLSENLSSIANAVKDVSPQAINNLDKMTSALQRLSGVDLKGLKDVATQSSAASVQAAVSAATSGKKIALGGDATKYERELSRIDKAIDRTKKKIDAFQKELAIEQNEDGGGDKEKIKSYNSAIEEQSNLLEKLIEQRKRLVDSGVEDSRFSSVLARVKSAIEGVANALKKVVSPVWNFGKSLLTLPFRGAIKNVTAFTNRIGTLASSFKRILFYRAIRTVIKEIADAFRVGTQNLYYYSQGIGGEFARSMDMAATSMLYFKNSIGAAVAPIVNALAPVLDMLVDKIVAVINAINQLIAKLTGATYWTKAIKRPKAYADAVSGAGKAAKEALRYLAPFDELNVLPSDRGGGGGGSSAAEDYSSMFEEMTAFDSAISDFAERIKAAIKAGDWRGAGKIFADKMNEIVSKWNSRSFGAKIGKKINNALEFAYGFLSNFNFNNLGSKIADGINGALENINFETAGRLFTRRFTALFDFIIGFVAGLDWSLVGKSIGDYLRGAFDEASEWIKGYDWSELGKNLYTDLKNLINGIDTDSLASSFFDLIGSALGAISDGLGGFIAGIDVDLAIQKAGFQSGEADSSFLKSSLVDVLNIIAGAAIGFAYGGFHGAVLGATVGVGVSAMIKQAVFKNGSADSKFLSSSLVTALGVISGAAIGFKLGGLMGAVIGAIVGAGVSVVIKRALFGKGDPSLKSMFMQSLVVALAGIAGAAIGFVLGGPAGAAIGATIGVGITLAAQSIAWDSKSSAQINKIVKTAERKTTVPGKLNAKYDLSKLPRMSGGCVLDRATAVVAGEAGKEAIIPLERNTEWISKVAREMREQASRQNASPFGGDIADDLEDANGVVVNAIFAATEQLIRSWQENNNGGAMNMNSLAREISRYQKRQAMATGV